MDAFDQYFLDVIRNHYADFEGRARRKEYWMFALFSFAIGIAFQIVASILGAVSDTLALLLLGLYVLFGLALFLPNIGLTIRRLHDTGRSGWWMLVALIPLVGVFVLIYFLVIEGDAGPNEYGPDPKDAYGEDLSDVLSTY